MIVLDLPEALEKRFWHVVRDNYHGDRQAAVIAFLQLHEKYGWNNTSANYEKLKEGCAA